MEVKKGSAAEGKGCPTAAQLETINGQAKSEMKPEQLSSVLIPTGVDSPRKKL